MRVITTTNTRCTFVMIFSKYSFFEQNLINFYCPIGNLITLVLTFKSCLYIYIYISNILLNIIFDINIENNLFFFRINHIYPSLKIYHTQPNKTIIINTFSQSDKFFNLTKRRQILYNKKVIFFQIIINLQEPSILLNSFTSRS